MTKNRCNKVDQSWYSRLQNLIHFGDNISFCIKNVYHPAVATVIFCLTHRIYCWGLTPVNQGFKQSIYRLVIIFSEFNVSIRLAVSRCFWHWQIAGCCKLSKTNSLWLHIWSDTFLNNYTTTTGSESAHCHLLTCLLVQANWCVCVCMRACMRACVRACNSDIYIYIYIQIHRHRLT